MLTQVQKVNPQDVFFILGQPVPELVALNGYHAGKARLITQKSPE